MSCLGYVSDVATFEACKVGFEKKNLNLKFKGETFSAYYEAAELFPSVLKKLGEEKDYCQSMCLMLMRRVFSENRRELARSYVKPKRPLFDLRQLKIPQPFCFAVMLLVPFCRNLCSSIDPFVLQGKNKNHLPVFRRSKKAATLYKTNTKDETPHL